MLLTGKHTVNAPINKIWSMLMDPDVLARITPSITSLVPIDGDNFTAIADVKIGPIKGRFTGTLKISERVEPTNFNLGVQQNSPMGNAAAVMAMTVKELSPEQTEVSFSGDVRLSGTLAVMGGRVITPVANMLSKMFFDDLQKEVNAANQPVNG
jgi:uncharacterized protein